MASSDNNLHDQYYAEENFRSTPTGGRVYTGPLLLVGFSSIMGCFTMSTATRRSRNLSFKWLQRRVAAQFMTAAYFLTCNVIYSFDGRRWVTRDLDSVGKRMFGRVYLDVERRRRAALEQAGQAGAAAAAAAGGAGGAAAAAGGGGGK